ncbi:IS21 family transposase [Streptacidiphilus pinicola]|uniref:IS21 family transposase n=1 Tax=Streptacidiphilus pinicola TaxID=2219663 RepID=A0A2X0KFX0_9ACTN|nr:ANTAR domain-containing protein [Streptacidiphilus pinicola]RAG85740.1 IS21 family transposase [Streptacidiphilus pinicola]
MLTREEYNEARVLQSQGWSVSAIARHLSRDRKTVRSYLTGRRKPGVRRAPEDSFQRFAPYCTQRLTDAAHLPASDLYEEIVELGYTGGYSTFTRALRKHDLRPLCPTCNRRAGAATQSAEPRTTESVYLTVLRLLDPPLHWGFGKCAYLAVGRLGTSGRWRSVLTESDGFAYMVEAIDEVLRRLGGTGARWILDPSVVADTRTAGRNLRELASAAEYYGASVETAPPRGERGGGLSEEDLRQIMCAWRTISSTCPLRAAQERFDQLGRRLDTRRAQTAQPRGAERAPSLLPLPDTPYPAQICAMRTVAPRGLVPFRGNTYTVAPDLAGAAVEVRWRLGEAQVSIAATSGAVIARQVLAPRGSRRTVSGPTEPITLERQVRPPRPQGTLCRRSGYVPLSAAAAAEARRLRTEDPEVARRWSDQQAWTAIAQAKGLLAAHRGISVEEAFNVLSDWARTHRLGLAALARDIVNGTGTSELVLGARHGAEVSWPLSS